MRQALSAAIEGKTLEEYAETHKELEMALQQWQE
jgi:ribulose 1,5-bisphosphate carboxylase large subunit-like protein